MFERYTESARRVIFFARYEASQFGSPTIEAEHFLLGMFREDPILLKRSVSKLSAELVRSQIEDRLPKRAKISISVDLPLSEEAKRVLKYAAVEADALGDRHIGTEHFLLGMLREEGSFAAQMLQGHDAKLSELQAQIAKQPNRHLGPHKTFSVHARTFRSTAEDKVEIHGSPWKLDYVREVVGRLREYSWHWQKSSWKPRDIVVACQGGAVSFDVALAQDAENFELVPGGWKKDHCAICRWELFETENADHGVGHTNGREWLCTECYKKFFAGQDFFGSVYSDIT